jgi:hypothetical protein
MVTRINGYTPGPGTTGPYPGAPHFAIYQLTSGGVTTYYLKDQYDAITVSDTDFVTVWETALTALNGNGSIVLGEGTFIATDVCVPAPYPADSPPGGTVFVRGQGMYTTTLKAAADFNTWAVYNGLIGYGKASVNPELSQLVLADLTLDGNYSGVDSGEVAQPASAQPALISLSLAHNKSTGTWDTTPPHIFQNVRFYRTPGYVTQPTPNCIFLNCLFDAVGQPDIVQSGTHYDIIGGGDNSYAKVIGCTFNRSAGNYVDFSAGTLGSPCKLLFLGNTSSNHLIGGVYGLGIDSIVAENQLRNQYGSNIAFDGDTNHANRTLAQVHDNTLTNVRVTLDSLIRGHHNSINDRLEDSWRTIQINSSGWTSTQTGTASVDYRLHGFELSTGGTGSSVSKLTGLISGLNRGFTPPFGVEYGRRIQMSFIISRLNTVANAVGYIQLKTTTNVGDLAAVGIGVKIENYTLTGESYGTARQTLALGTLTDNTAVEITIIVESTAGIVQFYVNGEYVDELTGTALPTNSTNTNYLVVSLTNGATAAAALLDVSNISFIMS